MTEGVVALGGAFHVRAPVPSLARAARAVEGVADIRIEPARP
ncbi:hypothetical protein [Streptomyces poonensis]|nr:hypothetical protein [Streptomyces poonensis]